jgi:hypothetical protein
MSEREFRIVHAGGEHVNAPQLVAIALGCLCVGVAFTHLVTRCSPSSGVRAASFSETSIFGASDALPDDEDATELQPQRASTAAAIATAPATKHRTAPAEGSHGRHPAHHFHTGAVEYVGCESGSASHGGHAPACPHDRALEASVWRALKLLASCYTTSPDNGHAELHVTVRRNRQLEVTLAAPAHGRSLNLRAVSQCAVPRLSKLRSHLNLDRAHIAFRFGLT